MNTFEMLLAMPAIPTILVRLLEGEGVIDEASLSSVESDPERLEDALSMLAGHGLIVRRPGSVALVPGSDAAAGRILEALRDVRSLTEASLMIRGILGATEHYRCLVHVGTMRSIMVEEGVATEHFDGALAAEEKQGYVDGTVIAYRIRDGVKEKFFPFIPHHHYHDFVFMHSRGVQRETGSEVFEERYLLGNHPPSIAEQARRYMKEHKQHILSRVQKEAFDIIWWYDRY